jgi:hypothetical protein
MIAPQTVIDRLKTDVVAAGTLRSVGGAGDLAVATEQMNISKCAFVVPGGEKAEQNVTGSFYLSQRVAAAFTVFFGVAFNDATGAKALDQVFPIREAIKASLVGWLPEGEDDPVQYSDGAIADIDPKAGFIVYAVTFFNRYELRS